MCFEVESEYGIGISIGIHFDLFRPSHLIQTAAKRLKNMIRMWRRYLEVFEELEFLFSNYLLSAVHCLFVLFGVIQ